MWLKRNEAGLMALSDLKRSSIITAAQQEFIDRGFKAANMTNIALLAEVSKRTLYKHFASKDELFSVVLDTLAATAYQEFSFDYSPAENLYEQLCHILRTRIATVTNPKYFLFFKMSIPPALDSKEEAEKLYGRLASGPVYQWMVAAMADGRIKEEDPRMLTVLLHSPVDSFCFWPQLLLGQPNLSEEEVVEIIDRAVNMFLKSYENQPA